MITKGIVESIINDYEVIVRLPILDGVENNKYSTKNENLSKATICSFPNTSNFVKKGDIVFVGFEDNDLGKPIILGQLNRKNMSKSNLSCSFSKINISENTSLPYNTSIGNINPYEISTLDGSKENIQKQITSNKENININKNNILSTQNSKANKDASNIDVNNVIDWQNKLQFNIKANERTSLSLIPVGTQIVENENLNQIKFLKVGKYFCSQNTIVQTLQNCPTDIAFMMEVFSPISEIIDNEETSSWVYRLRKLTSYKGATYYQFCKSKDTPGIFEYSSWDLITPNAPTPILGNVMEGNDVVIKYKRNEDHSWFREWKSGFKECGLISETDKVISLPITFSDTDYTVVGQIQQIKGTNSKWGWCQCSSETVDSIYARTIYMFQGEIKVASDICYFYCCGW